MSKERDKQGIFSLQNITCLPVSTCLKKAVANDPNVTHEPLCPGKNVLVSIMSYWYCRESRELVKKIVKKAERLFYVRFEQFLKEGNNMAKWLLQP
jgi:hypothetical protein